MTRTLLAALVATALVAGPAAASDRLAKALGITPGSLTSAELVTLKNALDNDDHRRVDALLQRANADYGSRPLIVAGFSEKRMPKQRLGDRRAN